MTDPQDQNARTDSRAKNAKPTPAETPDDHCRDLALCEAILNDRPPKARSTIKKMMESWGLFPIGFGSAITSTAWKGESPRYQENGVLDDLKGNFLAQELAGRRLAKVAKMLKYARDAGMDARYSLSLRKK